ncbi:hypothetical protein BDZ45DRAFT_731181 [Acephala macrosclerotiorum]|nr:hypothetical protein BDZ45DRAFT_731181 [Acephala macrosclerotiorum]
MRACANADRKWASMTKIPGGTIQGSLCYKSDEEEEGEGKKFTNRPIWMSAPRSARCTMASLGIWFQPSYDTIYVRDCSDGVANILQEALPQEITTDSIKSLAIDATLFDQDTDLWISLFEIASNGHDRPLLRGLEELIVIFQNFTDDTGVEHSFTAEQSEVSSEDGAQMIHLILYPPPQVEVVHNNTDVLPGGRWESWERVIC